MLIPRPETEFIVLECLRLAKPMTGPSILDIGAGSGNIPVAIARQHKTATLTAIDLSPEALEVARRNAARHGVSEPHPVLAGRPVRPIPEGERFDFVLSNPPYIAAGGAGRTAHGRA